MSVCLDWIIVNSDSFDDNNNNNSRFMSKYKYEKQFMFSTHRLEQVEIFLEDQEVPLDLPAIRDSHKNTVIHHTAYHNMPKVMECYLKYYRKNLESQNYTIAEIKMQTRLLLDQPNAQGYTAAHYAAYRGNITVLKLLQKYQAHLVLTTQLRMTMLHLAAQGDKVGSFLYLHDKGIDINARDSKGSTALHWAAFAGSDKIVQYLLAQQNIQINPVDSQGLTPLHLATTYGNSKIVRKLLIGGADKSILNKKNQTALDIAVEKQFNGIIRMLDSRYSLIDQLKILCNAKTRYEPQKRSFRYPIAFVIMLVLIFLFTLTSKSFKSISSPICFLPQFILFVVILLLFLSLVLSSPPLQQSPQQYSQFASWHRHYSICMSCIREMKYREHHCHICSRCILQYDHHCSWINNCIGRYNIGRFIGLLCFIEIGLLWNGYVASRIFIWMLQQDNQITKETELFVISEWIVDMAWLAYIAIGVIFIVWIFFGIPLIMLIIVQIKNLLLGKTTYQRYSQTHQSILTREGSSLANQLDLPPRLSLRNCLKMCYGVEENIKDGHHSSTTSSFVREK